LAFAGLQVGVDRVLDDHRRFNSWRLAGVPIFDFAIDAWPKRGLKLVIPGPLLNAIEPVLIAKAKKPLRVSV